MVEPLICSRRSTTGPLVRGADGCAGGPAAGPAAGVGAGVEGVVEGVVAGVVGVSAGLSEVSMTDTVATHPAQMVA